jgi:hypothetical protein
MRAERTAEHSRTVRVLLDIRRDGDGRVIGEVTRRGGAPKRFSGWLELLHLIEDHADETTPQEGTET